MKTQSQILNYPSLSEALFLESSVSNTQRNIRYVVLALAGSALISLCAQISVPFFPVPLTLQTFAVFLIGLSFGWRLGGITVALYLLEGALGLPVFAGGKGGLVVFMGPTAGYLYGMTIAAAVRVWVSFIIGFTSTSLSFLFLQQESSFGTLRTSIYQCMCR